MLLIFFTKYAWVVLLKDKRGITITNVFQNILKESNRKPNKIRINKGSEFWNRVLKSWLEKTDIEICSTHNKEKSVVAEGINRTVKNKIYKYMISISKNVYIDIH